jgi:hypothetical protein
MVPRAWRRCVGRSMIRRSRSLHVIFQINILSSMQGMDRRFARDALWAAQPTRYPLARGIP